MIIEPDLSRASIAFGNAVTKALLDAADAARPDWAQLAAGNDHKYPWIREMQALGKPTYPDSLVHGFMSTWASKMPWSIILQSWCGQTMFQIPDSVALPLRHCGGIENVELWLTDRAEVCLATMAYTDDRMQFGLLINCPSWIELGASFRPDFVTSFNKQIAMVVHHETGHFKQARFGRDELIANCRGLAHILKDQAVFTTREETRDYVKGNVSEAYTRLEIMEIFSNENPAAWRLLRMWWHLNRTTTKE